MYLSLSLIVLGVFDVLGVNGQTAAAAAPPPGESYVTGYPICNVSGFTEVPGPYTETTHQYVNATLEGCLEACYHNTSCASIAYAAKYTECLFFDMCVEKIQLLQDDESYFDHYDEICGEYY